MISLRGSRRARTSCDLEDCYPFLFSPLAISYILIHDPSPHPCLQLYPVDTLALSCPGLSCPLVPRPLAPSCGHSLAPGLSTLPHAPTCPPCHTPSCAPASRALSCPLPHPASRALSCLGLSTLSHMPSPPPSCALTLVPSLCALSYQFPHALASRTHSLVPRPLMPALSTWPPSRITTLCRPQYNYLY